MKRPISIPIPGIKPAPVSIIGVPVVPFDSYEQALGCVEQTVESRTPSTWMAVNPQKVYRAWKDQSVMQVLKWADVTICDGIGVSLAARLLHGRGIRRCTGCDLFFALIELAARKGWKVFLLGASPESNAKACERLLLRCPDLQIVGSQHGYFDDSGEVIRRVNASGADLLFVAMGSPRQEKWLAEHRGAIQAPFCLGVGGSFDVASGQARRAPWLMRKLGTEFLYQLVTQPWRWKRQVVYFPFVARVIRNSLPRLWGRQTPTA